MVLDKRDHVLISGKKYILNKKCLNLRKRTIREIGEITRLHDVHDLRILDLSRNNIETIENLNDLKDLNVLDLSHNNISKISGLETLENLRVLRLNHNKITMIEGLDKLHALEVLDLSHNQISDIKGLGMLFSLKQIHLSGNSIPQSFFQELEPFPKGGKPATAITLVHYCQSADTKIAYASYTPIPSLSWEGTPSCQNLCRSPEKAIISLDNLKRGTIIPMLLCFMVLIFLPIYFILMYSDWSPIIITSIAGVIFLVCILPKFKHTYIIVTKSARLVIIVKSRAWNHDAEVTIVPFEKISQLFGTKIGFKDTSTGPYLSMELTNNTTIELLRPDKKGELARLYNIFNYYLKESKTRDMPVLKSSIESKNTCLEREIATRGNSLLSTLRKIDDSMIDFDTFLHIIDSFIGALEVCFSYVEISLTQLQSQLYYRLVQTYEDLSNKKRPELHRLERILKKILYFD